MHEQRPNIPTAIKRAVLTEAGHRCAIPTCKHPTIEIAHIVPYEESKNNTFENLIALCPNCHKLYDRDKKIDRKSMQIYKSNLALLNNRYGTYERRVLRILCDTRKNSIILPGGHNIFIWYFLEDGILVKDNESNYGTISGIPIKEKYLLTDKGKLLIKKYKDGTSLD